jgi:hypothetical protein
MPSVSGVCICGLNNAPLFLKAYGSVETLQLHHLMYSALDVVLENSLIYLDNY